jgi:surfeit locus 1 family protein
VVFLLGRQARFSRRHGDKCPSTLRRSVLKFPWMIRRNALFLITGALAVLGCIRLGLWQLDRLAGKRAVNAAVTERLSRAPVPVEQLPDDTSRVRYHRVELRGTFDFDREIALTSRVRRGAPGVWILTPLRRADSDTAVLVNRGWVYSADGAAVDFAAWREPAPATVRGWTDGFSGEPGHPVSATSSSRAVHRLVLDSLRVRFPYPIAPYIVVWSDTTTVVPEAKVPVRLGLPSLGEGSHLSYAVQWFSFAAIGAIGMAAFLRARSRDERTRQRS